MAIIDGSPSAPAVVSIDPRQPAAHIHLLTWLTWPQDPERRRLALAAHHAFQRATFERERRSLIARIVEETAQAIPAPMGVTASDRDAAVAAMVAEQERRARQELEAQLILPAGGAASADQFPSWATEQESIARAAPKAACVGKILLLLRQMDILGSTDPRLQPSFNRAVAILAQQGKPFPSDKTMQAWWVEYRSIAPLCAGVVLAMSHWPSDTFGDSRSIAASLAWAKALRGWAVQFKHERAKDVLIPASSAAEYDAPVPTAEPLLPPLSDAERQAARDYRSA